MGVTGAHQTGRPFLGPPTLRFGLPARKGSRVDLVAPVRPAGSAARSVHVTTNLREAISTRPLPSEIVELAAPARRPSPDALQRCVAASGALLMALGMFTGLWSGVTLSGKVVVAIPRLALAAHLNALMGCFWLVALSFTLPMLSY